MSRSTTARIDTNAIRHNLRVLRQRASGSKVAAVIKADGYGHGLLVVAEALAVDSASGADMLAVATVEEALRLRQSGLDCPVLVLEGFHDAQELQIVHSQQLTPVIHAAHQLAILTDNRSTRLEHAWLKLNTGMHRLGFAPEYASGLHQQLQQHVHHPLVLMTHLANAELEQPGNQAQLDAFDQAVERLPGEHSIANSAATWSLPNSRRQWIRPGIMLYGISPFADQSGKDLGLKPAMRLTSELIGLRDCKTGDSVGYGSRYRCTRNTRIGIVAIGYGDGYPRHASDGTPVWVASRRAIVAGMPSMDMLTIALPEDSPAKIGDTVELWGEHIAVEEVAEAAGTIAYELVCQVKSRVHFEVV